MENIDLETYCALRHGGASKARACAELGVKSGRVQALETFFRRRWRGPADDAMRPRFARHGQHAAAVLAAGGYPVLR